MRPFRTRVRQRGQALIYGIFVLLGALAATFFVFNTGQLSAEKTKLVNTADAVAYSAGVMHARALNFTAYTNRALVANETSIAQLVSLASWAEYSEDHMADVWAMYCVYPYIYSMPVTHPTPEYFPLCALLSLPATAAPVRIASQAIQTGAQGFALAAEANKAVLQAAQVTMFADFLFARDDVLDEVADANYADGYGSDAVSVDNIPLIDNWSMFDGGFFIDRRSGSERGRMRELARTAADSDPFVKDRSWLSKSPSFMCYLNLYGEARRSGGTTLQTDGSGNDRWVAHDEAKFRTGRRRSIFGGCRIRDFAPLGNGDQEAGGGGAESWSYTGIPSFFELSDAALAYGPGNADEAKRGDPRLQFAIRVTRARRDQRISSGTSGVQPTGRLGNWAGSQKSDKMAAVATSEVFFDRKDPNRYGTEMASLFNPYWQVHLISNSAAVTTAALALP